MDDKNNPQNTTTENEVKIEPVASETTAPTLSDQPNWQPETVKLAGAVPDFDGQMDDRLPTAAPTMPNTPATDPAQAFTPIINERPRKNWKPLAIGLGGLAVILLGGSAAAYRLWYQNPDKVVGDALSNFARAKTILYDGKLTATEADDAQKLALTFNGANNGLNNAKFETALTIKAGGQQYKMSGAFMANKDRLYFKLGGLQPLVDMVMSAFAGPGVANPLAPLVVKLDNRWIVVTDADLQKYSISKDDDAYKCTQNVLGKLQDDKATRDDLGRIYTKNSFLKAKANLGTQRIDGTETVGYTIDVDTNKVAAFGKAFEKTSFYKELEKCGEGTVVESGPDDKSMSNDADNIKPDSIKVWIGKLNHELKRVELQDKDDNGVAMNVVVNTRQNKPVDISQPTDALTLGELQTEISEFMQGVGTNLMPEKTPGSRAL